MGTGYFSVTWTDRTKKEAFRGIAMAAKAEVHSDGKKVLFFVSDNADQFEQAVRQLVGSSNYQRYNRLRPGFISSGGVQVADDVLGRLFW